MIPIKIKSSYAFGSGYHETTKNCIKGISFVNRKKTIKQVLDYGCGSGILGISLQKISRQSKGNYIDIDKLALKLTKINLKENNLQNLGNIFNTPLNSKSYKKKQFYDLVLANILFDPLKSLIKEFSYILKNKSYLIISGILIQSKLSIINKYRYFNFYPYKEYNDNNWITIIFKKI